MGKLKERLFSIENGKRVFANGQEAHLEKCVAWFVEFLIQLIQHVLCWPQDHLLAILEHNNHVCHCQPREAKGGEDNGRIFNI